MKTMLLRVVKCGEETSVKSESKEGSLVFATLQFRTHEFNGKLYQDIEATEIYKK